MSDRHSVITLPSRKRSSFEQTGHGLTAGGSKIGSIQELGSHSAAGIGSLQELGGDLTTGPGGDEEEEEENLEQPADTECKIEG